MPESACTRNERIQLVNRWPNGTATARAFCAANGLESPACMIRGRARKALFHPPRLSGRQAPDGGDPWAVPHGRAAMPRTGVLRGGHRFHPWNRENSDCFLMDLV